MRHGVVASALALMLVTSVHMPAHAQGGATSLISGVVVDTNGGVIPGAAVSVKNDATGQTYDTVTNSAGAFSVPALSAGVYTVTVTLSGFKTAVLSDVRVVPGTPASVKATLELGQIAEAVFVQSSSELINSQTPTVSSTMNVDQINQLPLPTRNAINAVTFLPGVNTPTTNRNSTINGLPESFINITLDGVSNNDNFLKSSDGFFASVTPRQDAIEAVTVTTAVGGADVGGHGAATINFVTRSGTNRFAGSLYEYYRGPDLNTNYWFNERNGLPKNDVQINQYGARQGGPIVIPGLFDGRNKAFFFFNYEELRMTNNFSRTRSVLTPDAQRGIFRWTATVNDQPVIREVDLIALASRNNRETTFDPFVRQVLGYINAAVQTKGVLNPTSNPNLLDYDWQSPGDQIERQPVVRIDYNLSSKHRLSGTYNRVNVTRDPDHLNGADVRFPGAPNYRKFVSSRPSASFSLRSNFSSNIVNELRGGTTRGGASHFGQESSNGLHTFADLSGIALDLDPGNLGVTNWHTENGPSWRAAYVYSVDDTLNWQKGKHTIGLGGSVFLGRAWERAQTITRSVNLGLNTDFDPARTMFNGTNFPGASNNQLNDARDLYALLTGRVLSIGGQAALNAETGVYEAFAPRLRAGKMDEYSLFAQDNWRATPTLTLNGGVRWDVQLPFSPVNDVMSTVSWESICGISGVGPDGECQFFQPGVTPGVTPEYVALTSGTRGYNTDWNNVAPTIGAAWRPNVQRGFLRKLFGDPEQATLRVGYALSYERQGMAIFTGQYGPLPGSTLNTALNADTDIVPTASASWPVLVNGRPERFQPASFPLRPTYPIEPRPGRADTIEGFHPNIKIGSARTWMVGFQRALSKDMAAEIRYVGTRGVNQWSEINYNERNLIENGFLEEFKLAMANLRANNASGVPNRSGSFAYFGPGTGTSPLPIYLAYFSGRPKSQAGDASLYTSSNWDNETIVSRLVQTNPNPATSAADLDGNTGRRANAIAAGYPANLFVLNPEVSSVNIYESAAYSDYHALQVEVRRRLSRGLQINGSYQYALEGGSSFLGRRYGRVLNPTENVRHAIKTQWDWMIPVGRGERFGANLHPILNAIVGNWQIDGSGRVQSRTLNFGNVRMIGMTVDELTDMYKFRIGPDPQTGLTIVTVLPDDVILNTRRAFSTSVTSVDGYSDLGPPEGRYFAPANGADCIQLRAGDCAPRALLVKTPFFTRFDIGITKRFPLRAGVNIEFRAELLNAFDNINFNPVSNPGAGDTILQSGSAYSDLSNTFDPGGRLGQLVFRLNW
jgi:hypothetical protein